MKKDIYFYWGNDTMSYMRYMTLYSFCKFNPNWKVYLIVNKSTGVLRGTVEKQDKTEYKGQDYSNLITNLNINILNFSDKMIGLDSDDMSDVHIKDVLNWKVLSEWGGLVADMDILFIKPMIDIEGDIGLVCFDGNPQKDYIPVTFMYSSGSNEFFKDVYQNVLKKYKPEIYESCGTLCIKEKNIVEVQNNYKDLIVTKLNDFIVFPFIDYTWGTGIEMLYKGDFRHLMCKDVVGIHWYGGAPLSQQYNNILNKQTIYEIDNTITKMIRRML